MKARCNQCRGTKQYSGLGGIITDCKMCNATGFVDIKEIIENAQIVDNTPQTTQITPVNDDKTQMKDKPKTRKVFKRK